jgi:hypothetical protein
MSSVNLVSYHRFMLFCILTKPTAVAIVGIIIFLLLVNGLIKKSKLGFLNYFKNTYKARIADLITSFIIAYFLYDLIYSRMCS